MIVLMCFAGAPQAYAQARNTDDSKGSYNVPEREKSSSSRSKSLYTSKPSSASSRSGSKGAAYTSKATGSKASSQPLSVSSILNGTYQPKRVIAGYNDRTTSSVPYSSLKTRGDSKYSSESISAMRKDRISQLEATREQARLSYEERVAQRIAELQARREKDRMDTLALSRGRIPTALNAAQGVTPTTTSTATKRRQVYVKDNGVDEPTRLFDSAR